MKRELLLLTLLLLLLTAGAQNTATIKSFTRTTDHISGNDRRNDFNGTPCALVKIQVVDDIERVEGNKIGTIVNKGVEKWVYMCQGSRNMKVHLKNHLPVKVTFQDYQIGELEGNRVYELVIETPMSTAPTSMPTATTQKLILNYSPANATVLIDSRVYSGNGRVEATLPIGDHEYLIAADGYITVEGIAKLGAQAPREITEMLSSENPTIVDTGSGHYGRQNNVVTTSESMVPVLGTNDSQAVSPVIAPDAPFSSWRTTEYSKPMLKGEGAFFYEGLYYVVISERRRTVAVVKPKKVKYDATSYVIPSKVFRNDEVYTVTEIAPEAFHKSKNLNSITFPETLEAIRAMAFAECRNLSRVTFPSNLRYVGMMAFWADEITDIILPESIEELADNAFLMCKYKTLIGHTTLGVLYIPNTIKVIGNHAFCATVNGWGNYYTARFTIRNLPDWMTLDKAKKAGIHEDSFNSYIGSKR